MYYTYDFNFVKRILLKKWIIYIISMLWTILWKWMVLALQLRLS